MIRFITGRIRFGFKNNQHIHMPSNTPQLFNSSSRPSRWQIMHMPAFYYSLFRAAARVRRGICTERILDTVPKLVPQTELNRRWFLSTDSEREKKKRFPKFIRADINTINLSRRSQQRAGRLSHLPITFLLLHTRSLRIRTCRKN